MTSPFLVQLFLVLPLALTVAAATPEDVLSQQVGGRLYTNTPFAAPCFTDVNGQAQSVDAAACNKVQQGYLNESRLPLTLLSRSY